MKYLRWTVAWLLYWFGDLLSKLPGWAAAAWYPAYNRSMFWSSTIQGDGDFGPWQRVPPHPTSEKP